MSSDTGASDFLRELVERYRQNRLAYVAVTRAKDNLFVSYAKRRFINGMSSDTGASDFLRELVERYRQNQAQKPYEIITPSLLC